MLNGSIAILDFGSQYTHLIGRRFLQLGYQSEIIPPETSAADLRQAKGIVFSGGPQSVYEANHVSADVALFDLGLPILGICYGMQWMSQVLGGEVRRGRTKEYGKTPVRLNCRQESLLEECPDIFTAWMSHGDEVSSLPSGFISTASTLHCPNAAMANNRQRLYGLQFHPEVTHTEHGLKILKRFADICGAKALSLDDYLAKIGQDLHEEVRDRNVFTMVSGGVDSLVLLTLLNRMLGQSRVRGLLVDHGLMRHGEVRQVLETLRGIGINNLTVTDAADTFFSALAGVCDPEEKRRIIGDAFVSVQEDLRNADKLDFEHGWILAQGTIYPDTIESGGTANASAIKLHHNRSGEVLKLIKEGKLIEPLKTLYKDEVRVLGEKLGLPRKSVWRHPFPGPGLGVRILCATSRIETPQGEYAPVPHMLLPVRSVGVQGDSRTYRQPLALFCDDPANVPNDYWQMCTDIPNRSSVINRVVHCLSHKAQTELFFTPTTVTRATADLLRDADHIVNCEMDYLGLTESIWQFPVALLPFGTKPLGRSIVLRPVESTEAMTAKAARLPVAALRSLTEQLMALPGIDMVFYDLTSKPPGTIEWE